MAHSASENTGTFFTSEKALTRRFKASARSSAFDGTTRAEALAWQKRARKRLAQLLGLHHFETAMPRARKIEAEHVDGLTRELWQIQTERDVWMPFYLFVPSGVSPRLPLVICPHGHGSGGKWATAGRRDMPEIAGAINSYNYDYGLQLARAGFITACPDARGFGERREPLVQGSGNVLSSSCHHLTLAGAPLGLSVQGMWTWDLMRLVDFLSNDSRIDSCRIACAGLSGGGLQTLNLAALDTRIGAAIVSGYFYGARESLQVLNGNCQCNMVPGLWKEFDIGDIGALVAPRGLFVETGDADPLNGASSLKNVRSQISISSKVFTAMDAPAQLHHGVFEGGHRWHGEKSIPWLQDYWHDGHEDKLPTQISA